MDDFTALISGLHGFSVALGLGLGLVSGFVFAMLTYRFYGKNFRRTFDRLSDEIKKSYDSTTQDMKSSFRSLSSEALTNNQKEFLSLADRELDKKSEQHTTELDTKKELIDTQLQNMSETLKTVPSELEKNQHMVSEVLDKSTQRLTESTQQLTESNKNYLDQLTEKAETQTKQYIAELEEKKKLIDQQLEQMSSVLKMVPSELEKNQNTVSEVIEKSTRGLEESNKVHLNQLQDKSDNRTKEHFSKLEEKETLINRRLGDMDEKLGKVQKLIDEFEKARENKLGALDDQLKNLTQTTSELHRALADNRARGQWGERIAEDLLKLMGFVEGINFFRQMTLPSGERPDFTITLPTGIYVHMDVKYSFDNYDMYHRADNNHDRAKYADAFGRNVKNIIRDVANKGYINEKTVDCVVLLIPNEPVYRFMHEKDHNMMDFAMKNRVVLCSPMNLYPVLAVIHQAAQSLAFEKRSKEVFYVLKEIRTEWEKYTEQMLGMEKNFATIERKFRELTGARTRQLDKKFDKIDTILDRSEAEADEEILVPRLPG